MLPATPFQSNLHRRAQTKKIVVFLGLLGFFAVAGGSLALTGQLDFFRGDLRQRAAGTSCDCEGGNYVCHYSWGGSDSWPRDSCKQSQPTQAPAQQSGSSGGTGGGGGGTSGGSGGSGGSTHGLGNGASSGCCSSNGECVGWFGTGSTCSNSNGACASGTQCKGGNNTTNGSCHQCLPTDCHVAGCGGQSCDAACQTKCGNGVCENGESNASCPADCTAPTGGIGGGTGGTSNGMAYCAGNINAYKAIVNCTCTDWIRDGKDSSGNPCKTSVSTTPTPTLGNACTGGDGYCSDHKAGQSCGNGGTCSVSEQIASGGVNCECTGQTTSRCINGGVCSGANPGSKCGSGTCVADTGTPTGYNCHCTDPNAGAVTSTPNLTPTLPSGVATPNLSPTAATPTPTRPICPTPPACPSPAHQVMTHRSQGDWDCTTYTCAWPTATPQTAATPYQCPAPASCTSTQITVRTGPDIHGCYIEGCIDKTTPTPTRAAASSLSPVCVTGESIGGPYGTQNCVNGQWGPAIPAAPTSNPSVATTPNVTNTPTPIPSVTKAPTSSALSGASSQGLASGIEGAFDGVHEPTVTPTQISTPIVTKAPTSAPTKTATPTIGGGAPPPPSR